LQDANEMHFPEDRQKFTRSLVHRRETWRGNKADSNVYHKRCVLHGLLRSLSTATGKRCRQTDKTARASRNLKWVAWVLRMCFYSAIGCNDFMALAEMHANKYNRGHFAGSLT